jgi:mRNA interferase RelE/StbE
MEEVNEKYQLAWTAEATRQMDRLAETVPKAIGPIVEFCYGRLLENPQRIGSPLRRELTGLLSARVGAYRVIYRITDDDVVIHRVDHRSDVYRQS